jgi:periplasmic divalent cation tolerance protein
MIVIYTTCASRKEAEKISLALLNEKLAGCCNIFPMQSNYLWKGKIVKSNEHAIIIKTSGKLFNKVKTRIKDMHSYEIPCIEGWDVDYAGKAYAKWFDEQLGRKNRTRVKIR